MDWNMVLPELIVAGTGLAVLLVDLYAAPNASAPAETRSGALGRRSHLAGYLSLAGLLAALVAAARLLGVAAGGPVTVGTGLAGAFASMIAVDTLAVVLKILFIVVGFVVTLLGVDFAERRGLPVGEFFALLLFAVLGMMLMADSSDLLLIYLGLETTSIASYALAGLLRHDPKSGEAAIKYFLTGALASAVVLFGMALVFGATGTTKLAALLAENPFTMSGARMWASPVALTGLVLLIAGFGFKVAAVPFHFWAPDAYEGAPTPVTAFFSVGPKAAAFAAMLRIFAPVLAAVGPALPGHVLGGASGPVAGGTLPIIFTVLAVVTMTVGNLAALPQKNIKRMLAYSSIAHAGYLMVGLAVASPAGFGAIVYYLIAYATMNLTAFAVVIWLNNRGTGDEITDYAGLGRRAPLAALAMVVALLSLIGIPPTAGFFGKLYLFVAAVGGGMTWLAVVMVINSAISVGYYYGIVRQMYLVPAPETKVEAGTASAGAAAPAEAGTAEVKGTPLVATALALSVAAVLVVGFLFEPLSHLAGLAGLGL